tara:strand:- start:1453 stop:2586 length:1134 start_codon:yes stop_codon:yes gene_type:complete
MNKYNTQLLVEAKKEYTNQLIILLKEELYIGLQSMYAAARKFCKDTKSNKVLKNFQIILETTPKWDNKKLIIETNRIKTTTECDYLEDLLTAVFVSHVKVLSSIKNMNIAKNLELNIPTLTNFIHKVYIECAREFWKKPFLFDHRLSNIDIQRNIVDSYSVIGTSIKETVRKLLPVKDILKEYLGGNFSDESYDEINFNDKVSNVSKSNIRKILKLEIENSLKTHTHLDDDYSRIELIPNVKSQKSTYGDIDINKVSKLNNISVSNIIPDINDVATKINTSTDDTPLVASDITLNIKTHPKTIKIIPSLNENINIIAPLPNNIEKIQNIAVEKEKEHQQSEANKSLIKTILTNNSYNSITSEHLSAHLFDDDSVTNM